MNSRPSLENLDLELFVALQRERLAGLRQEAQAERFGVTPVQGSRPARWWLLVLVAAAPIIFWLTHLA